MDEQTLSGAEIYYRNPDGFAIIADEDVADMYEFDQVLVVRAPNGTLWAAHDSGCSCPTPFEDTTWPTDWVLIRQPSDLDGVLAEWGESRDTAAARIRVKSAVVEALRQDSNIDRGDNT